MVFMSEPLQGRSIDPADEAQLLPCFLPTDAQDAEGLAGRALNAARQALLER